MGEARDTLLQIVEDSAGWRFNDVGKKVAARIVDSLLANAQWFTEAVKEAERDG